MIVVACLILILVITFLREIKAFDFLWEYNNDVIMHLIPTWSFFAPIPNMLDYYLLYRVIEQNGTVSEWQLVNIIEEKRSFWAFIWNPAKKMSKSFLDITQDLLKICHMVEEKNQIYLSLPYLQLLNYVDSFAHKTNVDKVQFMIMGQSKLYDPEVVFISEPHALTKR